MSYTGDLIIQQPQSGSWLVARDMINHPIAILHIGEIGEEPDTYNPGQTRTVATISFVDLTDREYRQNVKVDKPGIVNRLSNAGRGDLTTGKGVLLGRIVQGKAEPGKNAPFLLGEHTPEDAVAFGNWWSLNADMVRTGQAPAVARPITPTPAPAPTKWLGEQAAQAAAQAQTAAHTQPTLTPPAGGALPLGPDGKPDVSAMSEESRALYAQLQASGLMG